MGIGCTDTEVSVVEGMGEGGGLTSFFLFSSSDRVDALLDVAPICEFCIPLLPRASVKLVRRRSDPSLPTQEGEGTD